MNIINATSDSHKIMMLNLGTFLGLKDSDSIIYRDTPDGRPGKRLYHN
jgi:hypothetical protein